MSTSGAPQGKADRLRRVAGWAREAPAKRVGGPVGALALAISGAFGGWAPVAASYDDIKAGEVVHSGPFDVSVDRVRAIDDLRPVFSPSEGNRYLVVILDVRNTTKEPVLRSLLSNNMEIDVDGAEVAEGRPTMVSVLDYSTVHWIQPGIDYELGVVYETVGEAVPTQVTVRLPTLTWREDSFTRGYFDWKDPEIAWSGTFGVKDVPDAPEDGDAE